MIISLDKTGFTEIKTAIEEYIASRKDVFKILDSYEPSVKTMLLELLAGYATYINFKSMMYFSNLDITKITNETSIMEVAVNRYGYNFNRATAPVVSLVNKQPNRLITTGEVFGSIQFGIESLDLVYMGEDKTLKEMESFEVVIGRKNEVIGDFLNFDFEKPIKILMEDEGLQIDNYNRILWINSQKACISKRAIEYIAKECTLDKSISYTKAELLISHPNSGFGVEVYPKDKYRLIYIATTGKEESLPQYLQNLNLVDGVYFDSILSFGLSEDSIEKIREIAPLHYTTAGVMSNKITHEILAKEFNGVLDVKVSKRLDRCCEVDFCVLLEGSAQTPRTFTDYELEEYLNFLTFYKYVGTTLTKDNIYYPTPVTKEWLVYVIYQCGVESDAITALRDYTNEALQELTLKLGVQFSIGEVMASIAKFEFNGRKIVKDVHIYENDEVLTPSTQIVLQETEYLYITPSIEVACK